jgi:Holliday junction resolvase RusA-like endonuclease
MRIQIDQRPISVNTFIKHSRRGAYITPRGKEWREFVQYHLIKYKPITNRLKVSYEFHFKGIRKLDVDNYIKPLQDTLEGFIYVNDEQIDEINAKKFYKATHDHVIIEIEKLD